MRLPRDALCSSSWDLRRHMTNVPAPAPEDKNSSPRSMMPPSKADLPPTPVKHSPTLSLESNGVAYNLTALHILTSTYAFHTYTSVSTPQWLTIRPDELWLLLSSISLLIKCRTPKKRNALLYLADDYITASEGNIGMVIGLDIKYRRTKEDGKMVRICEQTLRNDCFRSEDRSAVERNLVLQLGDFVLPQVTDRIVGLNIPITIMYNSLAQYLEEAEGAYCLTEMQLGRKLPLAKEEWRKRKRTPTPPLSDEKEKKFQEAEARADQ
ncbi:hypothetical protein GP486_003491 [Trichoglossum hirsutum]|uniref:Uncharacterized protein n=1 Tax=Trichoglossum hirsutum TaxID=265104 RepID=A0A9P8LCY6_9PEZI|nr:hypothetical protein GP486_003491 [Trichoglossum hirsutum]